MSFRQTGNRRDGWLQLIAEHGALLEDLPREAIATELAFRDYVTSGQHRGVTFSPSVDELRIRAR